VCRAEEVITDLGNTHVAPPWPHPKTSVNNVHYAGWQSVHNNNDGADTSLSGRPATSTSLIGTTPNAMDGRSSMSLVAWRTSSVLQAGGKRTGLAWYRAAVRPIDRGGSSLSGLVRVMAGLYDRSE
jgi:hypothetical protein